MPSQDRAGWLSTEAAAVCYDLTRGIFPAAAKNTGVANLPEQPLWGKFPEAGPERAIAQSSVALELLAQAATESLVIPELPKDVLARFRTYTRLQDLKSSIDERLRFQCRFPLALLNCIRGQDEEFSKNITGVKSVAGIFSQPWFHEMIATASNTTDSFWGTLGLRALSVDEIKTPPPLRRGVDILFHPSDRVSFSDETLGRLTHQKTLQNKAAKYDRPVPGNYSLHGTTDGCPIRPSDSDLSSQGIALIPQPSDVESDDMRAACPAQLIKTNLRCISTYLGRVAELKQ